MYRHDLIYILVLGLIAGWSAGKIMKGKGFGLGGDLIVGVLGAIVGSWLFGELNIWAYGIVENILVALAGSLLLLFGLRLFKKRN